MEKVFPQQIITNVLFWFNRDGEHGSEKNRGRSEAIFLPNFDGVEEAPGALVGGGCPWQLRAWERCAACTSASIKWTDFLQYFSKYFLQYFVRTIVNIVIFWYWIESFSRYILWMYYLPILVQWFLLFPLCLLSHAKFPGVSAGERFPADAPENVSRMADGRENVFPFCQCTDGRWSPGWQMIARSQHCERSVTRIPNDKSRPAWCWKTNPKNPQKVKGPGHGAQLVSDLSQKHSNLLQNFNFEITCVGFTEPRISIEWNDGETYLTTGLLGEACLYWKPFQFFKHC